MCFTQPSYYLCILPTTNFGQNLLWLSISAIDVCSVFVQFLDPDLVERLSGCLADWSFGLLLAFTIIKEDKKKFHRPRKPKDFFFFSV